MINNKALHVILFGGILGLSRSLLGTVIFRVIMSWNNLTSSSYWEVLRMEQYSPLNFKSVFETTIFPAVFGGMLMAYLLLLQLKNGMLIAGKSLILSAILGVVDAILMVVLFYILALHNSAWESFIFITTTGGLIIFLSNILVGYILFMIINRTSN